MSNFLKENKNFLNLEKKLLNIEEKLPLTNDAELVKAVKSIIDEELNKPENERDYGLIDEAIKVILPIINPEYAKLMDSINKFCDDVIRNSKETNSKEQ